MLVLTRFKVLYRFQLKFKVVLNRNCGFAFYTKKMERDILNYTKVFKGVNAIPSVISAKILEKHPKNWYIHTTWSSLDYVKAEKNISELGYTVDKETFRITEGMPVFSSNANLRVFSKTGKKQIILREKKSTEKIFLEVWNELKNEYTYDMSERKEHGKICEIDLFNTFELSSDEKFLLYTAEAKQPKSVSYFKESASSKEDDGTTVKGEEYAYREEWGEQQVGIHHPVLCILELETGNVEVLPTSEISPDISIGEAKWGPNDETVVFVAWDEAPYRLGTYACLNRRNALYSINLQTKKIERLTLENDITVVSPRFNPSSDALVYLENTAGGPHKKGSKLKKYDFHTKQISTVVDLVENPSENGFPGIYADTLPLSTWSSDGKFVYFHSVWRSRNVIVCVDVSNGKVHKVNTGGDYGSISVLNVCCNLIVAQASAPNVEPCLLLGEICVEDRSAVSWKLLNTNAPFQHSDIVWNVTTLSPDVPNSAYPKLDYDIIIIRPKNTKGKCPLIVMPHGGPHSCYVAGFPFRTASFVKLGYMLCLVNYRGSIGFGESNLKSLPGNVGVQDVADVQQAAVYVKNHFDVGDVFLFGGSHGGFLTAHLSGQFPNFYKAAVLLNPVIDISSMVGVTDIPDWCWVEAGLGDNFDASCTVNVNHLQAMWSKSPIRYAENVRIPSLLLLGKKDLRVPYSQGLKYYHFLKARNVPTKIYHYEDNHSLLKPPHDGDLFMQSILWFKKHASTN